ncbi:MAG: hypothetical protein ACTSVG_03620, partial [Alphaproteobacteria bacterium]
AYGGVYRKGQLDQPHRPDCKSVHAGSIPAVASNTPSFITRPAPKTTPPVGRVCPAAIRAEPGKPAGMSETQRNMSLTRRCAQQNYM